MEDKRPLAPAVKGKAPMEPGGKLTLKQKGERAMKYAYSIKTTRIKEKDFPYDGKGFQAPATFWNSPKN